MPRRPRVDIPENPAELLRLAADVYAQDQKLGANSPLRVLEGPPTWATAGPQVAPALALQDKIDEHERALKALYGQRQPYLDTFGPLVRNSRDLLLGTHAANPAKLGDYGYEVKTSPAPKPTSKTKSKAAGE